MTLMHTGAAPEPAGQPGPRVYAVNHTTVYRYTGIVSGSTHLLRLRPVQDRFQELLEHEITLSVPAIRREYEDVFGNQVTHLSVTEAYSELRIEARSLVRVLPGGALVGGKTLPGRTTLPIAWMPWQHQMMLPYLLPPEFAESELHELSDYARDFVARNQGDLTGTLLDMTRSLHSDMAYVPGVTQLETTPFEVYRSRRGVCQDFANLLICLARLERVPARYRVGYLYTGGGYENQLQSEASHAWVEAYLPWQGWKGLDPTNGVFTEMDHIRVATGRNFRDATPTSGVVAGGGAETLEVSVRVERLDD
jgi:transglutaminase-like putative cysteine protease